jgi:small subunit ribosomal protein S16
LIFSCLFIVAKHATFRNNKSLSYLPGHPQETHPGTSRKGSCSVLMIRLARVGARKQPHYRVVVIEKERARNGRSVEVVGTYNPRTTPASVELKRDRIDHWVGKGARMSETVARLVAKHTPASAEPAA